MKKLVLLRHGQSRWNLENRFTGWVDVGLTDKGVAEAESAARSLTDAGYTFDLAYTSVLERAIKTLWIVLERMHLMWIPVSRHWELNERHYGGLQGLDKAETAKEHGDEQVKIWRRSLDTPPPPSTDEDLRALRHDPRYRDLPDEKLPRGESLAMTIERVLPLWNRTIRPSVLKGRRVIIAAHGNSLRALVSHLDGLSKKEILELNIPTGVPLVYELEDDATAIRRYYLEPSSQRTAGAPGAGAK